MMYKKLLLVGLFIPITILIISASSPIQNSPEKDLIVHEWGTFTTLYGSDGSQLSGLYLEEESLPKFVYQHQLPQTIYDDFKSQKGSFIEPLNVTVKMETPVLYFYAKESKSVSVDVGFPRGSISQWYPKRNSGDKLPNRNEVDFNSPFNGLISWDNIQVLAPDATDKLSPPKEQETPTWISPRETDANKIKVNGEVEKFLFYRGIGNFNTPLSFQFKNNKELEIKNTGQLDIPFVFVYENNEDGANVWWTGPLKQGAITTAKSTTSSIAYVQAKFKEFKKELIKEGLYEKEAAAMLKTWENSYFKKEGFRVFYIVPAQEVDEILPINIIPTPVELKRVFVGRCDIFTPAFEQEISLNLTQYRNHRYYLGMNQRLTSMKSN